jgi:NAD-specific glutamate dehydrogenase
VLAGLYEDLAEQHRRLTIQAFASSLIRPRLDDGTAAMQDAVRDWLTSEVAGFSRWQRLLSELDAQSGADLAMIAVAIRALALLDAAAARAA